MFDWLSPYITVETVCTVILVVGALVMITLERLFPYDKGYPFFRKGFFLDFFWYSIIQSFVLKIVIFDFIIAPTERYFNLDGPGLLDSWPIWASVTFFVFTHDLYIYWFHRLQHTSKYFWRLHEAHHSVEEMDWVAGSRSHSLEIIINQTIEFLPIVLLLGTDQAAIVVPIKAVIDAVWGMYIHANIDVRSGRLQYVINGPEMHRWHHASADSDAHNLNYATKFAFWDWMFGTAFLPKNRKPQDYGLDYNYPVDSYVKQHTWAFRPFDDEKQHTAHPQPPAASA